MKVSASLFLVSRKALLSLIVSRFHPLVFLITVVIRCSWLCSIGKDYNDTERPK